MANQENELRYLQENLGVLSLKKIADNLGKSVQSLEVTLHRTIGNSNTRDKTGRLTAGELAKALEIDRNTVMGWINRHGLPYTKKITNTERKFTFISVDDFWIWAAKNKKRIDFGKLETHALPPEPSWVATEREKGYKTSNYKTWTTKEEQLLRALVEKGKDFNEITKILKRSSVAAVEKKFSRLNQTSI